MNYIEEAYKEAQKAFNLNEVPVGCVIVRNNKIIARAHNKKEELKTATCHAEIIAINIACKNVNDWRLNECDMYVTLEPCKMCKGAIEESRIKNVYYVVDRDKINSNKTNYIKDDELKYECRKIMSNFFHDIR